MLAKNWFPNPSPLLAPFTNPAISTISTVAGKTRSGSTISSSFNKRGSGTFTIPILGSIVQNGKFALWALALDKQLNNVDFPTFGNPTIPAFIFKFILRLQRYAKKIIIKKYYPTILITSLKKSL